MAMAHRYSTSSRVVTGNDVTGVFQLLPTVKGAARPLPSYYVKVFKRWLQSYSVTWGQVSTLRLLHPDYTSLHGATDASATALASADISVLARK